MCLYRDLLAKLSSKQLKVIYDLYEMDDNGDTSEFNFICFELLQQRPTRTSVDNTPLSSFLVIIQDARKNVCIVPSVASGLKSTNLW